MQKGQTPIFVKSLTNSFKLLRTTQLMHCPCNDCKNLRVFSDPTIIRSHVIVRGFVKDYTIWKKHGETDAPPQTDNPLVEIVQDEDFNRLVYSYFMAPEMMTMSTTMMMMLMMMVVVLVDPMDGDSSDDELDDGDFLGQLLWHTKA